MESCIICEKQLEDGIGRYHYPDGDYCHACGEKSKLYEKFSKKKRRAKTHFLP